MHIDAKVPVDPFAEALRDTDARLIEDGSRVEISWGGLSVVRATLASLAFARRTTTAYARYCLLSGADYPLQPVDHIERALSGPVEFITIDRKLEFGGDRLQDAYITDTYFSDVPLLNPRTGHRLAARLAKRVGRMFPRRTRPALDLYHGSCWWCLSGNAIEYILDRIDRDRTLVAWFARCGVPDEILFQSLMMASPFVREINDNRTDQSHARNVNVHGAHYIDWSTPNPSLPKVLGADDVNAVRRSGALFARKIDFSRSDDFIAGIAGNNLR